MKAKYWAFGIGFIGLSIAFHFISRNAIESSTPDVVSRKLDELMHNRVLMDSIGGSGNFELRFNENDFRFADTAEFSITIKGPARRLIYHAVGLRETASGEWQLLDEDLVIK